MKEKYLEPTKKKMIQLRSLIKHDSPEGMLPCGVCERFRIRRTKSSHEMRYYMCVLCEYTREDDCSFPINWWADHVCLELPPEGANTNLHLNG